MDNTYDSEYEVQKAILKKIGGDDTKNFDSPYEVQLEILDKVTEGGGGGAKIDDTSISAQTVWSSQKTKEEIDNAGGSDVDYYMTFRNAKSSSINISFTGGTPNIEYNKYFNEEDKNDEWTTWDYSSIDILPGEHIRFRGVNPTSFSGTFKSTQATPISTDDLLVGSGDIYSLIDGKGAPKEVKHTFNGTSTTFFSSLFNAFKAMTSAPYLNCYSVGGRTSGPNSFSSMFLNCTSLKSVDYFNISGGRRGSKTSVFEGCNRLVDASNISINDTEAGGANCFKNCSSLIYPAQLYGFDGNTFANAYQNCSKLAYAKIDSYWSSLLGTDFSNWLSGCASKGVVLVPASVKYLDNVKQHVPEGWQLEIENYAAASLNYVDNKILDSSTTDYTTWSSNKINEEISKGGGGLSAPFYTDTVPVSEFGDEGHYEMGIKDENGTNKVYFSQSFNENGEICSNLVSVEGNAPEIVLNSTYGDNALVGYMSSDTIGVSTYNRITNEFNYNDITPESIIIGGTDENGQPYEHILTGETIDKANNAGGLAAPFFTEHIEAEGEYSEELYNMGIKNDTYGIKLQQSRYTNDGETFDNPTYKLVIDGIPSDTTNVVLNRDGLSWIAQSNGQTYTEYKLNELVIRNRFNLSEDTVMSSDQIAVNYYDEWGQYGDPEIKSLNIFKDKIVIDSQFDSVHAELTAETIDKANNAVQVVYLTQDEYDGLEEKNEQTLYIITDAE